MMCKYNKLGSLYNDVPVIDNETVYSWVSRYHFLRGLRDSKKTLTLFFNKPKYRLHSFVPNQIEQLSLVTGVTSEKWLTDHTLYPLFTYFGFDQNTRLRNAMLKGGLPFSLLNISQSQVHPMPGHAYCSMCVSENREKTGHAFFDTAHQFPGVNTCSIHGVILRTITNQERGIDRKLTIPVDFKNHQDSTAKNILIASESIKLLELAKSSPFESNMQIEKYKVSLKELGLTSKSGQLKPKIIISELKRYYDDFQPPKGVEQAMNFQFIGSMLRGKSSALQHPFKHLLLITWLNHMLAKVDNTARFESPKINKISREDRDKEVIQLIIKGKSKKEIQQRTGAGKCVVNRVIAIHQFNDANRVKKPHWYPQFLRLAMLGRHRSAIAKKINKPMHVVETQISAVPRLVEWRKRLDFLRRLNGHTVELKRAIIENPNWSRQEIKKSYSKEFFYLYKYDRDLLEAILPEASQSKKRVRQSTKKNE